LNRAGSAAASARSATTVTGGAAALGAALGDGALAETGGATTATELACALAAIEDVDTAGPGAGSALQPRRDSAATMQTERNAPTKCLLLVAFMLT
jgi:hypothetical protein